MGHLYVRACVRACGNSYEIDEYSLYKLFFNLSKVFKKNCDSLLRTLYIDIFFLGCSGITITNFTISG